MDRLATVEDGKYKDMSEFLVGDEIVAMKLTERLKFA